MGNCLVTKLKGVVNNEMLPDYGYQIIKLHSDSGVDGRFNFGKLDAPAKLKGNAYFIDSNNTNIGKSAQSFAKVHVDGDALLEIPNGKIKTSTAAFQINLDNNIEVSFDTSIIPLLYDSEDCPIHVVYLYLNKGNLSGNITDFFTKELHTVALQCSQGNTTKLNGSLDDITFKPTDVVHPYNIMFDACSNLTGNLNSLFDRISAAAVRSISEDLSTRIQIIRCPNVYYNNASVGYDWRYNVVFHTNGTWSLGSPI